MRLFIRLAAVACVSVLPSLLTGCSGSGSSGAPAATVTVSPALAGNWNIAAKTAPTSTSQIAGIGGALAVSSSGAITGMLHALPAVGNASSSLCYTTANAIPVIGSLAADNTLTLTSSNFAGNTLTVQGKYVAGSGSTLPSLSNATYSIVGPCAVAAQTVVATQAATLSGTYSGVARFGANPTNVQWTTVFTQSTTADSSGGYPLIGTSNFPQDPCIVTPNSVNVTTSNVQYGTYISEDFVDSSTGTEVTAEGTSTDTTNATIALDSIKLTNNSAAYSYCNDSGTGYLSKGSINPPAATPVFSVAAGTYTTVQSVSIASATTGATIYYTTDGSMPTTSSAVYMNPITVSSSETLAAIAVSSTTSASPVASAAYVINLTPASLSVVSGSGQSVGIGNGFSAPLVVKVLDTNSVAVSGATVSFSVPTTGLAATFSSASCTTDNSGTCSVTARANTAVGTYTVTASLGALSVAFTLTNTGAHAYVVTVSTDTTTTGVASNCLDQATSPGSGNLNCSLRDALAAAAATASSSQPASVTFAMTSATTIALSATGSIALPSYTIVQGATSGAGLTLKNLISLQNSYALPVFTLAAGGVQVSLNNLTLQSSGSGAEPVTPRTNFTPGGAIYSAGSLTVNNSSFTGNQSFSGGAIANNGGTLTVFGCLFQNNFAQGYLLGPGPASAFPPGVGGAIDNYGNGTATISNSSFTGNGLLHNFAGSKGGAVYNDGSLTVTDSTIVGNSASSGAGIYNLGLNLSITNSIVSGNDGGDCNGIYCEPSWAYVNFASATPSPVDSNAITIAFSDSKSMTFSQTVQYVPSSSSASIAAAFGTSFSSNSSGLDTTSITGQAVGSLLVLEPLNGATPSPLTITNPGMSFLATQASYYTNPLSINHNVTGQTSAVIGFLQDNGGPTQTMIPYGAGTLCPITNSTETGTDQRGAPRTVVVGSNTCQDAGAVQTAK